MRAVGADAVTPADRCLSELRALGSSPRYAWAWTYIWFDHIAKKTGDVRNAVRDEKDLWRPKPLAEAVLETPAWREEAKLERTYGILPRYYYLDFAHLTGTLRPADYYAANRASMTAILRKAWAVHRAQPVFSWHMENPCTTNGYNSAPYRFKCPKHGNLVKAIVRDEKDGEFLPRAWFEKRLADIAGFLNTLTDEKGEKGEKIPVIIRYAHEMDGGWFWWGKDNCSCKDLIALARLEADFLRTRCDGQILFAYTPDRWWQGIGAEGADGYLKWYPGDAYVDILGYDDYALGNEKNPGDRQRNFENALTKMRTLSAYADAHGKAVVLSESGAPDTGFFFEDLNRLMTSEGVRAAFANTWIGPWTWPKTEVGKADLQRFVKQNAAYRPSWASPRRSVRSITSSMTRS